MWHIPKKLSSELPALCADKSVSLHNELIL
jgi:hypothetical protein